MYEKIKNSEILNLDFRKMLMVKTLIEVKYFVFLWFYQISIIV